MKETKLDKNQIPINFDFISNKTFENFIVGKNMIALKILKDLASNNHQKIVVLIGDKYSGKSHLCNALADYTNNPMLFLNDTNISNYEISSLDQYELLIVDNIDLIISNSSLEEKIFTIINEMILLKKKICITSTSILQNIKFRLPDLLSGLKSDQIINITELSDEDKIKVLQKNASERGWLLKSNVCDYIINHYKRDLFFLCGCIKYIDTTSLSLKKNITIPFIKKIMSYK